MWYKYENRCHWHLASVLEAEENGNWNIQLIQNTIQLHFVCESTCLLLPSLSATVVVFIDDRSLRDNVWIFRKSARFAEGQIFREKCIFEEKMDLGGSCVWNVSIVTTGITGCSFNRRRIPKDMSVWALQTGVFERLYSANGFSSFHNFFTDEFQRLYKRRLVCLQ